MAFQKKILMVVTNHDHIDATHPTGLWLEEYAAPYQEFLAAGFDVVVASPKGGISPIDPRSLSGEIPKQWQAAATRLQTTEALAGLDFQKFDAIVIPGGHGPLFDLANNEVLAKALQHFATAGKIIGAVCHGPAGLVSAILPDGTPFVAGKKLTAFSNSEEKIVQLDQLVPFLLEDKLKSLGAVYVSDKPWATHVVVDGKLVTGQNPQSSSAFAKALVALLQ